VVAVKVAQMLLDGRFQVLGLLQQAQRSDDQARDERWCWVCASALGASWELRDHADVKFYDGSETSETLSRSEESGAVVMNDGCEGKSPRSDSCDARALASLVGRARIVTSLLKAQDGGSSWTWSVAEGRASPRDRAEWFAMCAVGVADAGACSDEAAG
jgi:hypothetical protein